MTRIIVLISCLLSVAVCAGSADETPTYSATLPNGAVVELVAVATNQIMPEEAGKQKWWRPDGAILPEGLFHYPGSATSSIKARQFILRIKAEPEFSCMTATSQEPTSVQPAPVFNTDKTPIVDLLVCAGQIDEDASVETLRVGVATGPWEMVEQWKGDAWEGRDPDNIHFPSSENPLVFFWPRTKRGAVVLEMVSTYTDQAVRLKITDKSGHSYYEYPRTFGRGDGVVRHQYWVWDTKIEDLRTMTFEARPYHWAEFQNVSTEPDHSTDVRTVVLPVDPKAAATATSDPATCQGSLLDGLSANVKLPARGHAVYEVDAGDRVVRCDYWFDGSRYRFRVTGPQNNYVKLFDGYRSVTWMLGTDYATVNCLEYMPIVYRLGQYCPTEIIRELLAHNVVPRATEVVDGVSCKVLENVFDAKTTLKLWVATEPGVFPVRIERCEHEVLRDRYEARDLRLWNGVVFPKTIETTHFRPVQEGQPAIRDHRRITVHSFEPGLPITPQVLSQDLPNKVLDKLPELKASACSLVGKPLAVTRIAQLADHIETGQPAIVCFIDIDQRPSRHYLNCLKDKADSLKQQGFKVLAVQVVAVESGALDEWTKENDIPFAILPIGSDFDQQRFGWGITSLPWIVRIDPDHFVQKEGLSLEDLDQL